MARKTASSFRIRKDLVGAGRFERPTPCAQGRCATRLRYAPTITGFEWTTPALQSGLRIRNSKCNLPMSRSNTHLRSYH
jgi:hypothetical protein